LLLSPEAITALALVAAAAYALFAITGFGAALIVVPALSFVLPLPTALPVAVLLDVAAALMLGVRVRRETRWPELTRMVPLSLAGAVCGVTVLVQLPRNASLVALAVLIAAYAVHTLREGEPARRIGMRWAYVAGFTGGAMGTLFGVGAPPYAIYLQRRLFEKDPLRATITTMVLFSTGMRLAVFTVAGLVLRREVLELAGWLLPAAALGIWAGSRAHVAVSRRAVVRVMSVLLLVASVTLLSRALA
jgi:uncharacterized membrane protein YfcA